MKARPILFSGPMVRALLAGTKTQTRRVCKPAATLSAVVEVPDPLERGQVYNGSHFGDEDGEAQFACPYGGRGERLWVRETHYLHGIWSVRKGDDGKRRWTFSPNQDMGVQFDEPNGLIRGRSTTVPGWYRRPSIHMPRWASRITLEVTGVRVERLQDISEADARAEGVAYEPGEGGMFHVSGLAGCSLEVARTIMNRAARLWRTNGKPWLATAPLIEMLDEKATRRQPYPITWQQQANLLPRLPVHLQRMVLFAISTGARDANVCRLRWEWERPVPELGRSVFVIPPAEFKTNRTHVLILNDVAWSIVEACRGLHPDFVFTYRRERVKNHHLAPAMDYKPIATMNNTAFQNARAAAGLERMRVHDLRHTFGQRLRDAGVPEEDRALLLGHAIEGMPQHYATATIARLVEMANKVRETFDRTTILRVVNG